MSSTKEKKLSVKNASEPTEALSGSLSEWQAVAGRFRSSCPLPLSGILPQLTKPVFHGQNKTEGFLAADWEQIIGEQASLGKPVRLRNKVLTVCCDAPSAMALHYESARLIDRINHWFGRETVTRLKIVQDSSVRTVKNGPFTASPASFSVSVTGAGVTGASDPVSESLPSDLSLEECLARLEKALGPQVSGGKF